MYAVFQLIKELDELVYLPWTVASITDAEALSWGTAKGLLMQQTICQPEKLRNKGGTTFLPSRFSWYG